MRFQKGPNKFVFFTFWCNTKLFTLLNFESSIVQTYFLVNNLPCLNVKKKSRRQRLKSGRRSCLSKTNTVFFGQLRADTKFDWLSQIAANPFLKILKRWWLLSHFLIIVLRKKGQKGVSNNSKRILRQDFGNLTKLTRGCVLQVLVFPKM